MVRSPASTLAPALALVVLALTVASTGGFASAQSGGLVAAYSFSEGTGTTVTDASGNGNTGTISGATWTTAGKFGNALAFNGTNARVTVPNAASLQLTTGMTLEAWVYATVTPSYWRAVIDKNTDGYYLLAGSPGDLPGVGATFASGNVNIFGTAVLTVNTWTHLASTFDGATLRLYVNGVQVASQAQTAPLAATTGTLQIGGDTYGEYFQGTIDEVRIYSVALTAAQIQADMTTPVAPPGPDTQPPTAPANLTATAVSGTQINLNWTAATDNVGVTGYLVEQCAGAGCASFAQIGTTTTATTFSNTGLTAGTSYSYRVRATDAANNLGPYSNVASATTTAPDTQPPTAPANLTATAISGSQINLSWTAATDNVGVTGYLVEQCAGAGCASFAQIGTTTTATTFNNTGLTAGTSYSYRVRATDAANNLGAYSNVASATTTAADTQPPTAPANLTATVISGSQINLSWAAATDNVGVTGYLVERCAGVGCSSFAQIGTTTTATTFNNTGLTAGTSYSYRVRATDAANNLGAYSNVASATTQGTLAGLVAAYGFGEGTGTTVADVSGSGNTGTISGATWTTAGKYGSALAFNGTNARITIADAASLRLTTAMTLEAWVNPTVPATGWSAVIAKTVDGYYLLAGSPGGMPGVGATFTGGNRNIFGTAALALNAWTHLAATFDGATLRLYVNGVQTASLAQTTPLATTTGTLQIGADSYGEFFQGTIDEVRIYNVALTAAQIQADMAAPVAPPVPDTQPPTAPASLAATAASGSQINLSWAAATDNVGVTGYLVERCQLAGCASFAQVGTATTTTYSDTGLTGNTSYSYRVRATDAANNLGPYSSVASATTPAPDTTPPTAPTNLTATAVSGSQINLSWTAATDDVGVSLYRLERCQGVGCSDFVKLDYPTGTTYSDMGLASNTSYSYIVRASDAAGNLGPYSNVASATTQGTVAGLVAAYAFGEGTGTTVADSSGNGNTGTISGATWTTAGKYGSALAFNGTNARITVPDAASLRLTTGMTLEAWVNPTVAPSYWRALIAKNADGYYLLAGSPGGLPGVGATFTSGNRNIFGTAVLALNTWTHVAATFDGAMLRLYLNGVQAASQAQTTPLAPTTGTLQIGGDTYGEFFQGTIDEVRIYSVALTAAQIQSDMNTPVASSAPDTQPPTTPANLTATAVGGSQINLTWTAATDNVGVTAYLVERCQLAGCATFAQVATASGTTYNDMALAGSTTYRYRVRATDAANNLGPYSNVAQAVTGFSITPRAAAVTFTQKQQFTASVGGATWSVDGVAGGSPSTGTITTTGLYTPPGVVGSHTVTATASAQSVNATVYVTNFSGKFTHNNDNLRTGQNQAETVLTLNNVNSAIFGKLFSYPLDGIAYASPLYVASVSIPGQGFRNVVYVATAHNSVYAFDADGLNATPYWQVSFINPGAGVTTVPPLDTGECCDITPEIGITGTPVIDPSSGTLYVVAKTKEVVGATTNYVQKLHALDITTGAEKFGGPVLLQASVPGTGAGTLGGQIAFDGLRENQRPALLLSNGVVYLGFASHGDNSPWHGWVLGYNATTLQRVMTFNVTANSYGGGIWMSGGGLAADAAGAIYFVTGNGGFDANTGGVDYGDTFVKLGPSGAVLDYFTPHNQATLETLNTDLGAGGLLLLPDQPGAHPHMLLSAGKDKTIYLVDRDTMGHYNPNNDNQIVQSLVNIFPNGTPEPGNYSAPVYFNGTVYFSPIADTLQAFRLTNGLLSTAPVSQSAQQYVYPGGTLAISANGSSNGILWAVQRNGATSPGVFRAYDAANLGSELYNSSQAGSRDALDVGAKFSIPLVANGKVFVTSSSRLTVYGLLP